ncbi:cytochrome P450 78A3 [Stachybotrys elegans]|uniref:Cytochrome P450 78A3 n=1 Tax=Stachybotrys elegans TaxID=80388 RepID=A0A8K0WQE7_9HYPO|nr:cytochrome P450 78A3 [Stachybotrys elegans]
MAQVSFLPLLGLNTIFSYLASRYLNYDAVNSILTSNGILFFTYFFIWSSFIYPYYVSELRHIPTVPGCPIWGQFFNIITEEVGTPHRRWHEKHGLIVRYFFPFGGERISVAEDDALKHMTVRNPYNYPKPLRARLWMRRVLGEGVLLAESSEHAHQRKALSPGFSIQSIRALHSVFWEKALLMCECIRDEMRSANQTTISAEMLEWNNRTTLDIISKAGFGYDVDSLTQPETPLRQAYRQIFDFSPFAHALYGIQAYLPWVSHLPVKMNRDLLESGDIIRSKATEIIHTKIAEAEHNTTGKDIIGLIAKDNKKLQDAGEAGLSFETMRDQIMTFLGAGHDTTATGVSWTIHLLSTHPEVQSRLREEIKDYLPFLFKTHSRFDPDELEAADVDQLPYLEKVCKESLRYIPPIPLTVRQTVEDDKLAGYHIPAGTVCYVFANCINRLSCYWGDSANKFDPERWDNLPPTWTNNAFMTFLQGPRGCIGRKFAETEMKMMLCSLLSMYDFKRDEDVENPEDWKMWRLVLRPKNGVVVKMTAI